MNEVTRAIAEFVAGETGQAVEAAEKEIEIPRDPRWGDYAFPCFSLARVRRKAPPLIAQEIARKFQAGKLLSECTPESAYLKTQLIQLF